MTKKEFERIVAEIGLSTVPEKSRSKVKNVAFLIEYEPDKETRSEEGLDDGETLLGLYRGIPSTERGSDYGVGMTLPDTITLYQGPIEEAGEGDLEKIKQVVGDTIWHEVAHHFGLDHDEIEKRDAVA